MLSNKIFRFIACFAAFNMVCAYPQDRLTPTQQMQRLSAATEAEAQPIISSEALDNLYRYERTLSRLRRALDELAYEEADDDMELAEINVFRPLFRYRSQVAKQVGNPQQQFG
ncbi:uncharacterized protein LOC111079303 isoform X2 [Drosophila obscura]|uniref:uncharacterized protein LOC111079303 isoform X2 n=1 Tax=Drosophila obscura TaxID=7282 RepID=UPI001BB1E753|nr:uncharacterized protein LOC111079303 isoform X2 [Drosophila obscura]